jgi:hypothetical protein
MSLRRAIKKFSLICAYCDHVFISANEKNIDRLTPKKKKLNSNLGNMVCACDNCKKSRNGKKLSEWLNTDRLNSFNIYCALMRNFTEKNYSDLIYKKVRECF